jgi:hypothetical protein
MTERVYVRRTIFLRCSDATFAKPPMTSFRLRSPLRLVGAIGLLAAAGPSLGAQVRIKLAAWQESVLMDTIRQEHEVKAPAAKVYQAALKAFADLDIPTGRTDGTRGIIGSERFERMRSLAGAPMSRSFTCGEGALGPYADSFRLEIAVVVWVKPVEGGGTALGVATVASGRDVSGVFRGPQGCTTTGELEMKLLNRVKLIVAS